MPIKFTPQSAAAIRDTVVDSFKKFNPAVQVRNPVMFVVFIGSIATTVIGFMALCDQIAEAPGFVLAISFWLWLTVFFANVAEAMAEGRGKARRKV